MDNPFHRFHAQRPHVRVQIPAVPVSSTLVLTRDYALLPSSTALLTEFCVSDVATGQ
jgi:hypothetical protein